MTSTTHTSSSSIINSASPILVCCWFILLSTILTLHNKYVLDEVFRSSNGVLTCQCIFAITTLLIARRLGYVSHFHASPLTATRMELFCSGCASLNVVTGLGALAFVNVVTHGVLKRGAIVASWIIEFLFERKDSTIKVVPAVGILIFGSIVAGYGDLKFSVIGYTLAIISCFAQGSMFELGRRLVVSNGGNNTNEGSSKKSSDSSSSYSAVLYLNSLATVVVALPLFFVNARETAKTAVAAVHIDDDHSIVSSTSQQLTLSFLLTNAKIMPNGVSAAVFHLAFNGLISLLMNHAIFWNCAVNSSLAHTVSGNLKAALQTLFGAMLFVTPLNFTGWVGVGFNILGATTFSVIRLRNSAGKQQQQQVSSTSVASDKEGKMHQHQHQHQHQQIGSDTKQQQSGV